MISVDLQYDLEALAGDYLHTPQFRAQKDIAPARYWRAEANLLERRDLYATHRLYRAAIGARVGNTDVRVGRQRIAWGTGRFWSPLDVLNPVSPTALEREERPGVDAVLLEHKAGPLSRLSAVAAPSRIPGQSSAAVHWHDNVRAVDYSVVAGRLAGRPMVGLDLAGQIGQAGVRAEWTAQGRGGSPGFARALFGVDYAFESTLTLTSEWFFNGAGARHPSRYDFAALMSGRLQSLGRRYVGLHAGYEITPLLKWDADWVLNVADRSRFTGMSVTWSMRTNVDVKFGVHRFAGAPGTEYARPPDVTYAQLQCYF